MPHTIMLDSKNLKGVCIGNLYLKARNISFTVILRITPNYTHLSYGIIIQLEITNMDVASYESTALSWRFGLSCFH